jgi:hypothetical protein
MCQEALDAGISNRADFGADRTLSPSHSMEATEECWDCVWREEVNEGIADVAVVLGKHNCYFEVHREIEEVVGAFKLLIY